MSDAGVLHPGRRARAVPLRLRSDERLARQTAAGDTDAFAALYERHHRSLYRYCRSIVTDPEDAADALQSTMTRALDAIGSRDQAAPVRAWLFRIAHNESISLIRRRRPAEPLEADTAIGPDVAADAELRHRLSQLVSDLQALSERQRGALLMRELSGLSHAEIAAALEVSVGAVKQSIFEARTALHDFAAGRDMQCQAVQRQLSDGDGRTARSRALRAHLRSCAACNDFRDGLKARTSELAAIAPVLPAATAAAVLEGVIGGGGGAGGGGLLAGLLGGGVSKGVAVGAAAVTAGAGTATYTATRPDEPPARERNATVSTPTPQAPKGGAVLPATVQQEDRSAAKEQETRTLEGPGAPERRTAARDPARSEPRSRRVRARTAPAPAAAREPEDRKRPVETPAPEEKPHGRKDERPEKIEADAPRGRGEDPGERGETPGERGDVDGDGRPGRSAPRAELPPQAGQQVPASPGKPVKAPKPVKTPVAGGGEADKRPDNIAPPDRPATDKPARGEDKAAESPPRGANRAD